MNQAKYTRYGSFFDGFEQVIRKEKAESLFVELNFYKDNFKIRDVYFLLHPTFRCAKIIPYIYYNNNLLPPYMGVCFPKEVV